MKRNNILLIPKKNTLDLGLLFLGPKSQEIPLAPEHVSLTWRSRLRRTNSNQVRAVLGSNGCIGSHDGGECFGSWANGGNPSVQRRSLVDLKRTGKDKLIN